MKSVFLVKDVYMLKDLILTTLNQEVNRTTGCTDPGAVALATARAVKLLGALPQRIDILVSPNIYKNGVSVGIPRTDRKGLYQAAALGMYLSEHTALGLDLFEHADQDLVRKSRLIMEQEIIKIRYEQDVPDPLYVRAEAFKADEQAWTVIQNDYTHVVQEGKNREVLYSASVTETDRAVEQLKEYAIPGIVETILDMDSADFTFLLDAAWENKAAAFTGLESSQTTLGPALYALVQAEKFPASGAQLGKFYTAAAAEARMIGLNVPIMAIAGSGNLGITNFLGLLAAAEALKVEEAKLARGLAVTSIITILIKAYIKRMTAFCGCAVAGAAGVAAGTVYLLDGDYEDMLHAIHSVLGALAGVVCDGAKASCAYKVSTASAAALEYAYLAREKKVFIPASEGIVSSKIEDTFKGLARLNNPGMIETDRCLLKIIEENQKK